MNRKKLLVRRQPWRWSNCDTQALLERGWPVVATSRRISKSKELKPSPDLVLVEGEISKKETAVKVVGAALF